MAYSAPADRVVYEERQDDARALRKRDRSYHPSPVKEGHLTEQLREPRDLGWQPPVFYDSKVPEAFGGEWPEDMHIVFIHGLTSAAGRTRLVNARIEADVAHEDITLDKGMTYREVVSYRRQLEFQVMDVAVGPNQFGVTQARAISEKSSYFRDSTGFLGHPDPAEGLAPGHLIATLTPIDPQHPYHKQMECADANALRLFAGQADPADPSHFTIDYVMGTTRGRVDGWLQDDDTIKLRVGPERGWRLYEDNGAAHDSRSSEGGK